jgi:hypothetical protein
VISKEKPNPIPWFIDDYERGTRNARWMKGRELTGGQVGETTAGEHIRVKSSRESQKGRQDSNGTRKHIW